MTHLITDALVPLRADAQDRAESAVREHAARTAKMVADAGGAEAYLTEARKNRWWTGTDTMRLRSTLDLARDPQRMASSVAWARKCAGEDVDSFAAKLIRKVGEGVVGVEARVAGVDSDPWARSTLIVTKADGNVEYWLTQRVQKTSTRGKLFFQWPTRKLKRAA